MQQTVWRGCVWTLGKWGPPCRLGESGGLARQKGKRAGSWHQTVEGDRREKDATKRRRRARHNIKPSLCTEYVSMCIALVTMMIIITRIVFYCSYCFRKINHLVVKNHLHSSSGVQEVKSSTPRIIPIQRQRWHHIILGV